MGSNSTSNKRSAAQRAEGAVSKKLKVLEATNPVRFTRRDAVLEVHPAAIVGRRIRVEGRDGDSQEGMVTAFDAATAQHEVAFDGCARQHVLLAAQRCVHVAVTSGDVLPAPTAAGMEAAAGQVMQLVVQLETAAQQAAGRQGRVRRVDPALTKQVEELRRRARQLYNAADVLSAFPGAAVPVETPPEQPASATMQLAPAALPPPVPRCTTSRPAQQQQTTDVVQQPCEKQDNAPRLPHVVLKADSGRLGEGQQPAGQQCDEDVHVSNKKNKQQQPQQQPQRLSPAHAPQQAAMQHMQCDEEGANAQQLTLPATQHMLQPVVEQPQSIGLEHSGEVGAEPLQLPASHQPTAQPSPTLCSMLKQQFQQQPSMEAGVAVPQVPPAQAAKTVGTLAQLGYAVTHVVWPHGVLPPQLAEHSTAAAAVHAAASAEHTKSRLLAASASFRQRKGKGGARFRELDVSLVMSPEALVHRDLRVYWEGDNAWFLARVEAYCADTGRHKVNYADGDQAWLYLGIERVRLLQPAGDELVPPTGDELRQLASAYMRQIPAEQQRQQHRQKAHAMSVDGAMDSDDEHDDEDDRNIPALLRAKAAALNRAAKLADAGLLYPRVHFVKPTGSTLGPCGSTTPASVCATNLNAGTSLQAATPAAARPAAQPQRPSARRYSRADAEQQRVAQLHTKAAAASMPLTSGQELEHKQGIVATAQPEGLQEVQQQEQDREQQHQQEGLQQQCEQQQQSQHKEQLQEQQPHCAGHKEQAQVGQRGLVPSVEMEAAPGLLAASTPMSPSDAPTQKAVQSQVSLEQQQQRAQAHSAQQALLPDEMPAPQQVQAVQASDPLSGEQQPQAQGAVHTDGQSSLDSQQRCAPDAQAGQAQPQQQQQQQQPPSVVFSVLPGEVVWVLPSPQKGGPIWPAVVITREEADDWRVKGWSSKVMQVHVQYFGHYARARVAPKAVIPLEQGLAAGIFAAGLASHEHGRAYAIGMGELQRYLQDDELPAEMVPAHNDEEGMEQEDERGQNSNDGESEQEEQAPARLKQRQQNNKKRQQTGKAKAPSPKHSKQPRLLAAGAAAVQDVSLPLKLSQHLELLCLGRIEFVHPRFHTEKHIFPVGYTARRLARTPASGKREAWHSMEVLEAPDGSGPLFRVTPAGGKAVEGPTPTAAWDQLYTGDPQAARNAGRNGAHLFGLSHERVHALVQALPDAARCEGFLNWSGERPQVPPLSAQEQLQRSAKLARMQRLPAGITPMPLMQRLVGACDACGDDEELDGNWLVECDRCRLLVHMECYGVLAHPAGSAWLCNVCMLPGLEQPPPCALCPRQGGAMKPTTDGRWVHLLCATWTPEVFVEDDEKMEPVCVDEVSKARTSLTCSLCRQPYGACIQCCAPKCYTAFHPSCAREAALRMLSVTEEPAAAKIPSADGQRAQKCKQGPPSGEQSPGGSDVENRDANVQQPRSAGRTAAGPPSTSTSQPCDAAVAAAKAAAPRSRKRRSRSSTQWREGTATGTNSRLLCFCSRHKDVMVKLPGHHRPIHCPPHADTIAAVAGDGQQLAVIASGNTMSQVQQWPAAIGSHATHGHRPSQVLPALPATSQLQYRHEEGTCARSRPGQLAHRRGLRAPEALAAALAKRLYVRQLPYIVTTSTRHSQLLPPPQRSIRTSGPGFVGGSGGSMGAAGARALSLAERFELMQQTLTERVAAGKSAIHGWGAFAKTAHKAGDLVIEYKGSLVRPVVADLLESRHYNDMVGAGTYIFRLNDDMCVDATRTGNIAHLLNHSCGPCCHSRTITVRCRKTGELRDHVVICASRNIAAGEELTYDYRFAGDEKLRCNCGAASCRGWVNYPHSLVRTGGSGGDGELLVLRRELTAATAPM